MCRLGVRASVSILAHFFVVSFPDAIYCGRHPAWRKVICACGVTSVHDVERNQAPTCQKLQRKYSRDNRVSKSASEAISEYLTKTLL